MKNKIFLALAIMVVVSVFNSCTTPPIEAAQEAYDYNAIVPKVFGINGPSIAIQTFTGTYAVNYYRGGSKWNWSVDEATVQSVSEDTHSAVIEFSQYPSDGKATVTVTETTAGGLTSDPVSVEVQVKKYCPLVHGIADLVGSWDGDDGQGDYTYPSIITSEVSGTKLAMTGISVGFINDFWAETVIAGGTVMVTINIDGTVDIPRQYIYTTEYDGDPYDYEIKGSGTWDNCTSTPSLLIDYDIYYAGDADGLAKTYASYLGGVPYLTADIQLDASKSAEIFATELVQNPAKEKKVK